MLIAGLLFSPRIWTAQNPQVWQALTIDELWQLSRVERSLAAEFLRRLIEKCPGLLDIRGGLELIAHFQSGFRWI